MTKIAKKHLDPCDQTKCKFCRPVRSGEYTVCCFGLRHEGCVYLNPEMEHMMNTLAEVEKQLVVAKYEADPWWAAKTRNEKIDFPEMDNLFEPFIDKVAAITKKVYNFIYRGHEYTHVDNSMDYKSCPHCGYAGTKHDIGYYGSGRGRIICFECDKCFEKYYYHDPE